MKREEKDRRMFCSIDYEIEKKTVLMFAWCVIRMLETFLGAFFQHHEVLERVGWVERRDNWNEIFRKLAWCGHPCVLESVAGQFNCLALRRDWGAIEMGFGWGTGAGVCQKPYEMAVRIKWPAVDPNAGYFFLCSYPCMNYIAVSKDNLGVRPV